ncbi:hypothetical protein TeGR_g7222 [Tetraparma gracilis]|uniref:Uncharacterized protein n=1 Tax=Tetraparma gracilis TaxID=2962635 RepID=A0ABQ6MRE8_9STRA|nr:hypothetical protein TeGR_g7222 [Tetraparma gracilis]
MPSPFDEREIIGKSLWKKLDDNTYFVAQSSCEHDDFPPQKDRVRMHFMRCFKLTRLGPRLTGLKMIGTSDLGGVIPSWVNEVITTPYIAGSQVFLARFFASVRPADSFDEGDGTALGQVMFLHLHQHRQNKDLLTQKILDMIRSTNVLRSAQAKYRFVDEFVYHIMRNQMKLGASQTSFVVKTHLVELTANEAGRIARSFPVTMMTNVTAAAAVDQFIMIYQALRELDGEYAWFRPMLTAIATELMSAVAWGVKLRAYLGAFVSAADALSDAVMINEFFQMGDTGTAKGLLAMVGANLSFQMAIVYMQCQGLKKDRWRKALYEMTAVVSFTKPGLDAYRVASGAEQLTGAAAGPLQEMIATKMGELVFEAIPGLVLQLAALLNAGRMSKSAAVSILISTASTALTATSMFWDWDTDPGSRRKNPEWAGIVPDINRGGAFAVLFVMNASQVIAKAAAVALLAVTNSTWLLGYIVADHAVHIIYRIARHDYVFYFPAPSAVSYALAPLLRVVTKTVSDFTGGFTFRLPLMLGGSYWLFNLAMSQVSVFVSVHLYLEYADAPQSGGNKIEARAMWVGAGGLAAAWLITWIYFVFRIAVPKYRHTLWSWTSGRQCVHDYFYKGKDDEAKFLVFKRNLLLWENDIGDEVKAWLAENWARWKEEKPEWFQVELAPDRFIPAEELEQLGHNRKRRGSAAGSVRDSFRELIYSLAKTI